jgi:hypothetical protein
MNSSKPKKNIRFNLPSNILRKREVDSDSDSISDNDERVIKEIAIMTGGGIKSKKSIKANPTIDEAMRIIGKGSNPSKIGISGKEMLDEYKNAQVKPVITDEERRLFDSIKSFEETSNAPNTQVVQVKEEYDDISSTKAVKESQLKYIKNQIKEIKEKIRRKEKELTDFKATKPKVKQFDIDIYRYREEEIENELEELEEKLRRKNGEEEIEKNKKEKRKNP